jgi:branched-chain amino acid transport system substrate-binding protein
MNKKIIWIIVILIVIGVALSAGQSNNNSSDVVIKIGQASTLSGLGADIGVDERNGALLALEQINAKGGVNGKKLEMISADINQLNLKEASSAMKKLIEIDDVAAVVGPQWDGAGSIAASMSQETKTVFVSPNVSPEVEKDVNSEYMFSTWYSDESGIKASLDYMKKKGYKKVAVIQPSNGSFWAFTTGLLKKNAPAYGIEIVSEEYGSDFSNIDYRTLITKTKKYNPDAVFGSYSDLGCTFLQQVRNQGITVPFISTSSAGNPKILTECADLLSNSLYFSTPKKSEAHEKFEKLYEERFGARPTSPTAITAYDAMYIIAEAIEKTNSTDSEKIKDYIANISFRDGSSLSKIEFDELGFVITPEEAFEMQTVQNGQFVGTE